MNAFKRFFRLPLRKRLPVYAAPFIILFAGVYLLMIKMPGKSYRGPLPPLTAQEQSLIAELKKHVKRLAGEFAARNTLTPEILAGAADYLQAELTQAGYSVSRQGFEAHGTTCYNLMVELKGRSRAEEVVVVGAHYDAVVGSPGANDNASGTAAIVALARMFAGKSPERTLRFVEFVNEEPPFFQTGEMGSLVYAKRCRQRGEKIAAMLSLEMLGYYTEKKNSQRYPFLLSLFYPSTGNFIGFVGNLASRSLVREVVRSFRQQVQFPAEGAAVPGIFPGVAWSDHWSFWEQGYRALQVTDTALYRYPYYHTAEDTPDKINYEYMARVVMGLQKAIDDLTQVKEVTEK